MNRYEVTQDLSRQHWVILDRHLWDYCALPAADANGKDVALLPLTWSTHHAAEAWLNQCYRKWAAGIVPAPRRWAPLPPGVSSPWVVPAGPPGEHWR